MPNQPTIHQPRNANAAQTSTAPSPQPTRKQPTRRRIYLGLLVIVLIASGWFAYPRLTRRPTPRQDYWLAQIVELDPPGEGAISSAQAYALLDQLTVACRSIPPEFADRVPARWKGAWDFRRQPSDVSDRIFTSQEYIDARATLRDAVIAGWREPLGPEVQDISPNTHCYLYKHWCESLLVHSRWARRQQESTEDTVEDWLIALRLGRQVSRARMSSHQEIASLLAREVAKEMIYTSRDLHPPIDTFGLMQEMDTILGPLLKPSEYLEGERLWIHALLENVYVREGGDWLAVSEVRAAPDWPYGHRSPSNLLIWNLTSPFFHDLPTARRRVELFFEAANGATCLSDCSMAQSALYDKCTALRPGSADGLPQYARYDVLEAACMQYVSRCMLDAAVTMLALHEYRLTNGEYPESLDMLVPEFLPRLPIDYADLGTLRYRRDKDQYVLYSLGHSNVDNGGQGVKHFSRHNGSNDVVFTDWGRN